MHLKNNRREEEGLLPSVCSVQKRPNHVFRKGLNHVFFWTIVIALEELEASQGGFTFN